MLDYDINLYSAFSSIKYADDRFVRASFFYSENSNGMVHTMDGVKSLNYDLENNRRIKLEDLFEPNAKYLKTISAYSLKILQSREPVNGKKLADGDWADGAAAQANNFECNYQFNYSRRDKTWQLVRAVSESFNALEPKKVKTNIRTPRNFGKVDVNDFALAKIRRR